MTEIDTYLANLEEPKKGTLEALRATILEILPDAEEALSYGMPAFRVKGKVIAGFAAFKDHCSYLPHSGSVLETLGADLDGYSMSKGALRFPVDQPLPKALVRKLIGARLAQAFPR